MFCLTTHRNRAFSLIELLVVISVITLMITLLLPVLRKAREAGRAAQCASNLRQVGVACYTYELDHGTFPAPESYPTSPWFLLKRERALNSPEVWDCPSDVTQQPGQTHAYQNYGWTENVNRGYAFNTTAGQLQSLQPGPDRYYLAYTSEGMTVPSREPVAYDFENGVTTSTAYLAGFGIFSHLWGSSASGGYAGRHSDASNLLAGDGSVRPLNLQNHAPDANADGWRGNITSVTELRGG